MDINQKPAQAIHSDQGRRLRALQDRIAHTAIDSNKEKRPFITVSYAQSVDGSIATKRRQPLRLSGQAAMVLTHRLRAISDAILIGIETALADDPHLTVRLVEGKNPQPIVLDTRLRLPPHSNLSQRRDTRSWLISGKDSAESSLDSMRKNGATVVPCAVGNDGLIDLAALMPLLYDLGIRSMMVEGGARVITSFVNARMVDQFIITVAPMLVGGLPVFDGVGLKAGNPFSLHEVAYEQVEEDLVIWARPDWEGPEGAPGNIML